MLVDKQTLWDPSSTVKHILLCKKLKSFVDNSLNFSDGSFNSFPTSMSFVLFEATFLLKYFNYH